MMKCKLTKLNTQKNYMKQIHFFIMFITRINNICCYIETKKKKKLILEFV